MAVYDNFHGFFLPPPSGTPNKIIYYGFIEFFPSPRFSSIFSGRNRGGRD